MSQPLPGGQNRVELSADLRAALQRAHGYALQQSHRFITVEHVLLALNEDPDAALILEACGVDQSRLHVEISSHLGHDENRFEPGETVQPVMDPEASRIINSAVAASQKSGRSVVNGAIVLAAIIGDGRSAAANSLRAQGLTFEAAIRALQQGASAAAARSRAELEHEAPAPPQVAAASGEERDVGETMMPSPAPPPARVNGATPPQAASGATEDLLADARSRVEALQQAQARQRAGQQAPQVEAEPDAAPEPDQSDRRDAAVMTSQPGRPPTPDDPRQDRAVPPQAQPAADPARRLQERLRDQAESMRGTGGRPFDDAEDRAVPAQGPGPQGRPQPQNRPQPQTRAVGQPVQPSRPAPQSGRPQHGPAGVAPAGARPEAPRSPVASPHPGQQGPMNPRLGPFAVGGGADGLRAPNDGPMPQRPLHQAPGGGASPANRADPGEEAVAKRREAPSRGRQASAGLGAGQLHENIPRKMRAWVPCRVEIRIARAEITNVASGMAGSAPPVRHEIGVTKAMSVRLRAPEGGFFIEQVSPETQWIESQIGLLNDDYASWRWTVTPTRRGKARLQLIVSARTVGADGLAAERALPDQVIEVAVSVNYVRLLTTWGGWVAAAIAGGLLAKFGEGAWALGMSLLG